MEEAVSHVEGLLLAGRIEEAAKESRALLLHGGEGVQCLAATDGLLIRLLYVVLQSCFLCGRWGHGIDWAILVQPLIHP